MTTVEKAQRSELAQLVAYHEMRQTLADSYPGQWVVLCNSELVGHYDAYEAARTGAREQGTRPSGLPDPEGRRRAAHHLVIRKLTCRR